MTIEQAEQKATRLIQIISRDKKYNAYAVELAEVYNLLFSMISHQQMENDYVCRYMHAVIKDVNETHQSRLNVSRIIENCLKSGHDRKRMIEIVQQLRIEYKPITTEYIEKWLNSAI